VRIAAIGPDHVPPMRSAVQRLIALGHQRIVILERATGPATGPTLDDRAALEEMAKQGLPNGPYNLPDWEATPEGLRRVLDELFRVTAPTALILDEAFLFHAAKEHLAQKGILAPKDVSLICIDADPTFEWCQPSVAHIQWDSRPWVRRIVRWANDVSRGEDDRRQSLTKAKFVDGGTVGRAPRGR
jgi:DNA-binding LacI/PurR family transcriptional regulator